MRPIVAITVLCTLVVGCKNKDDEPTAEVWINEIVASNTEGLEENGTTPDWVELYNPGSEAVDLTGWTLTDNLEEPKKWSFVEGTSIPKKGYLVLFCDSDPGEGVLHTSFNLEITGEEVGLFDARGNKPVEVDSVVYGPIASDYAWGRMPGEDEMVIIWPPTPGEENRLDEQPPGGAP